MSAAAASLLEVVGLSSGYGATTVVRDLTLRVAPGEIVALLGRNGMGKTTLLRTVMGYLRPMAGEIRLKGSPIGGLKPHRVARLAVAYSPQEAAIFQDLTVEENLRLALAPGADFGREFDRVTEAFAFLRQRRSQRGGTLSGGEQKMLLVARALIANPAIMLVDEISEGLQPSVIDRLAAVIRDQRSVHGTAVLFVEQNVAFALKVADRFGVMKRGELVDDGRADDADAQARIDDALRI